MRGIIPDRSTEWSVMPDLYFYRDPEEIEQNAAEDSKAEDAEEAPVADAEPDWSGETEDVDWAESGATPAAEEAAASNW